jgi:hypothetical protein
MICKKFWFAPDLNRKPTDYVSVGGYNRYHTNTLL